MMRLHEAKVRRGSLPHGTLLDRAMFSIPARVRSHALLNAGFIQQGSSTWLKSLPQGDSFYGM